MIIGYRTQSCSVWRKTGFPAFSTVLSFETVDLGNRDIYHYMKQNYGQPSNLRKCRPYLNLTIKEYLAQRYGTDDLVCIWLCDKKEQVYRYGTTEIYQVTLPDNATIVSDLGADGKLYVFPRSFIRQVIVTEIVGV